jgi:hypothetical protein
LFGIQVAAIYQHGYCLIKLKELQQLAQEGKRESIVETCGHPSLPVQASQSRRRGVQVTHFSKTGISPNLDRAGLPEKQEQVTWQLKLAAPFDQNWSK